MEGKGIVREWIGKADEDYSFAASALELEKYFAQICFHFQQAAEKYLKSFVIAHELEFSPVHNVLDLLEICKTKDLRIKEIEEEFRYLNPFYIDTRYPVHWPTQYDKANAIKAKAAAEKIGKWIKVYLGFY